MKQVAIAKSRMGAAGGGLEKYAARIAAAFQAKGCKVTFLTAAKTGSHPPLWDFCRAPVLPWPSFLRMEQFDRFVHSWQKQNRADLVFGMDRIREQTHLRAGNGVHAAYLQSRFRTDGFFKRAFCKVNPLHLKILELEKEGFEHPALQKLFTNSHMVRREILEHYRVDPAKIETIHNGVEWEEMEPDFGAWQEKRQSGWLGDPNRFHFLFIGNGYRRKGLDPLLEALALFPNRGVFLSVIGKDKEIEFYRRKAASLGLAQQVRFFGPRKDIRSFYQCADALAIPSFYDPFANVTVEALAMGLTVVSSRSNGGSEVLSPENGILIDDLLDRDAVRHALETALQRPKTAARAAAIRKSAAPLDFSKQLNQLIDACL